MIERPSDARPGHRLGDEEEAWYRVVEPAADRDALRASLEENARSCSRSGCPLADDEDAWSRP